MSTSCKHRWVMAFYDTAVEDEGEALQEVVAIDTCEAVKTTALGVMATHPGWVAEAMGTRVGHFQDWLHKDVEHLSESDEKKDDD